MVSGKKLVSQFMERSIKAKKMCLSYESESK